MTTTSIFDKYNAVLDTDEIGYREWTIIVDGLDWVVSLGKNLDGSWQWVASLPNLMPYSDLPAGVIEFGNYVAIEFSKHASV